MSQIFHFIHFPTNASDRYGFSELKISGLRSSVSNSILPEPPAKRSRDDVWLFHASFFEDGERSDLNDPTWEPQSKVLVFPNGQKVEQTTREAFELVLSDSEIQNMADSNPYWLLNQLFVGFDQYRQAIRTIDQAFLNLGEEEEISVEEIVASILADTELNEVTYQIVDEEEDRSASTKDGFLRIEKTHQDLIQIFQIPSNSYNKITAQILTAIADRVFDVIDRREIDIRLDAIQQKFDRSQKALIQSEKLSVAGKMTAAIAHEINNPLQGVRNCFHLVSNQNIDQESKEKYLEMTNQELDRLTTTVQRMLEFYKPNEEFKTVQLLEILEHTLNLLQGQLMEYNIQVKTSWPLKVPPIQGIADQIEQVFMNLILNARDFMRDGGELKINIEAQKPFITITFEDSGPGVAPEFRDHIFEPFVSSKGTAGLGLSVCHEIITNHQGMIELMDDLEDHGARFKIILPIKQSIRKGSIR